MDDDPYFQYSHLREYSAVALATTKRLPGAHSDHIVAAGGGSATSSNQPRVGLTHNAFGVDGNSTTQARLLLEAGIIF